jgi:hypothetical protein
MRLLWLCPLLLALLAAPTAFAAGSIEKKVECDKGDSITAAAADLAVDKSYLLRVTGTCNENVLVDNFEGLALTIMGDPSATIQGLTASPAGQPVVLVSNSRRVNLLNFTILTSGGVTAIDNPVGVAFNLCRGCQVSNSTINTSRQGINLINSQATIAGITINGGAPGSSGLAVLGDSNANVMNLTATGSGSFSGGFGLLVDQSSRARLGVIPPSSSAFSNYSVGIQVRGGSSLEAGAPCNPSGCIEVHDNGVTGIQITSGQATFIGTNVTHNTQGIVVQNAGTLIYAGPASITGSTGGAGGVGLLVTHNSHAVVSATNISTGTNITGNSGRGVGVAANSSVEFIASGGVTTVTGNDGAVNIACDSSSLITGTVNLAPTTISCVDQTFQPVVIP